MIGVLFSVPPYRLISATVTSIRTRGGYVPRSVSPARGLEKEGLQSTTTDLPDADSKDRPKGMEVASKYKPKTTGIFETRVHDKALDQALVNSHIQPVSELGGSTIDKAPENCNSLNLGHSSSDFKPEPTAEGSQPHIIQEATSGQVSSVTGSSTIPVSMTSSTERESSQNGVGEGEEVLETLHLELVLEHQRFLRDHELAEKTAIDETLALSTHKEEAQIQSSDQGDLMLAIDLADGSVQDYTTFVREQSESREAMQRIQTAHNIHQEGRSADQRAALELQALLNRDLEMAMTVYEEDRDYALRLQNESSQIEDDRRLAEKMQFDVDEPNIGSTPASNHIDRPGLSIPPLMKSQSDYWSDHELASRLQAESNMSTGADAYDWPEDTRRLYAKEQNEVAREEGNGRTAAQRLQDPEAATAREAQENIQRLREAFSAEDRNFHVDLRELQNTFAAEDRKRQADIQRLQDTFAAEDRKAAAHAERVRRQDNSNCVVCNDEFAKAAMFRVCKHEYCRGCLIGT